VLVFWPTEETHLRLERLNIVIQRPSHEVRETTGTGDIDLEPFGLTYPVTIEDLVEDWENVDELFWQCMAAQ